MKSLSILILLLASGIVSAQDIPSSGLRVHLKADAGTSTTTDGVAITQWNDQSGNEFHATAPAGQPVYQSNAINGQPALFFNGGQVLHLANSSTLGLVNNDYELFIVAKSSWSGIQFLISGSVENHEVHLNGSSGMRFIPRTPVYIDNGANTVFTDGTQRIFSARASSFLGMSRVNGVDVGQSVNSHSSSDAMVRLGMRADGGFPLDGHIAEVIIYNRLLTESERTDVEQYLATKYAVSGSTLISPTVSMSAPETSQDLSVTFSGTVNPNGVSTSYQFLYGTDENNLYLTTDPTSVGSGTEPVAVSNTITGLSRHETYHVKLVAKTTTQTSESEIVEFNTDYVQIENVSVGITPIANQTEIRVIGNILVPSVGGSEYKIRFGDSETEFASADNISGTFNVDVGLPNDNLVFGTSYDVVLIGKGPSGKLTYGDTLSIRYVGYPSAELTSATPFPTGDVILTGNVNPNGSMTAAVIQYGTDPDNLTESTESFSIGDGISSVSITDTLSLSTGQTYWFRLISSDGDDLSSESDLISASTAYATVILDSVTVTRYEGITFNGRVNPNGFPTEYRLIYGSESTVWMDAGNGTTEIPVNGGGISVTFNQTYPVVLEVRTGSNVTRSDTLSIDTYFVDVTNLELVLSSEDPVLYILLSGLVDSFGASGAEYQILFGTDPEALTAYSDFEAVDVFSGGASVQKIIGGDGSLVAGTTYYVALQTRSSTGRMQQSDVQSIRFAGLPVAVLDSITTSQNFSARFDAHVNPNGGSVSYVIQYGTDRNNLNQTSAVRTVENTGLNPVAEWTIVENLTPGAVYYATLAVTNENYATQRSDTLEFSMKYATIVFFNPDVEKPTDVRFYMGLNPHGSFKMGQVNYGASSDHLNRSIIDSTQYSGTNMVSRTLFVNDLSPDSTYYAQWVITDLTGGPTTYSEVVELNTTFSTVTIDSIATVGNLTLGMYATVDTKNLTTKLKRRYGDPGGSLSTNSTEYTIQASTEPVSVVIPFNILDVDELVNVSLVAENSFGNDSYADTLTTDTYFVQYHTPSVSFSGADVVVRAELQAQPNLEFAYRVLSGTHPDSLSATDDFVTMNTPNRYTDVEAILDASSFTPGTTYYFTIEGRGTSGWITRSDTLSLAYQAAPFATTPVVETFPNYSATIHATVFPNERPVTYWFVMGTSTNTLLVQGTPAAIAKDVDSLVVSLNLANLDSFSDYFISLAVQEQGQSTIVRTDTVAFNTNYPLVYVNDITSDIDVESDGLPIMGRLTADVEINTPQGTAWVMYGTHPDSLIQISNSIDLESDSNETLSIDILFGPLDANKTYYAKLVVDNGFKQSVSDLNETETSFPGILLTSVYANSFGSVYIQGNIQSSGFDGVYGMMYGTHPDSLTTQYNERTFTSANVAFNAGFELYELDKSKTYYAYLYARSYSGKIGRTATFSWDFIYPEVVSSNVITNQDLTARVDATIDTKGLNLDFWVEVYNGVDGWNYSDTIRVTSSASPVDVSVPIGSFDRFEESTLVLALKADGKPETYADTTNFDLNYPELANPVLVNRIADDQAVIGIAAEITIPDQTSGTYRVFFGEAGETLTPLSDPVDILGAETAVMADANAGPGGLIPGATYQAIIEAVSHTGKTSLSDTLSIVYVGKPMVQTLSVQTTADFTASFAAAIAPNGRGGVARLRFGPDSENMYYTSDTLSFTASMDEQDIMDAIDNTFFRNQIWFAVLDVESEGFSTIRSDTITFNFNYPSIAFIEVEPSIYGTQLTVSADAENYGINSEIRARFGYTNHPDSLVYAGDSFTVEGYLSSFQTYPTLRSVNLNDSVYVQLAIDNGFYEVWTPIRGFYTRAPVVEITGVEFESTGTDIFSATITGSIQTNGVSTTYRILYDTQSDFPDGQTPGDVAFGSDSGPFTTTLTGLIKDSTYHAYIDVYDDVNYRAFTQSDIVQFQFTALPDIDQFELAVGADLSVHAVGTLLSNRTDLRYRAHYGTAAGSLIQSTDWVDVAATTVPISLNIPIPGFSRFGDGYVAIEVEPDGLDAFRTDTVMVVLTVPLVTVGDVSIQSNGDIILPLTIDNGGYDATFDVAYGTSVTDTLEVDGSDVPVEIEFTIPSQGAGVIVAVAIRSISAGLLTVGDTLLFDIPAPEFNFVRAFAKQGYKGVFDAVVNPNSLQTFVKFEYGVFGSINQSTTPIDLGSGTEPVSVQSTEASLYFNGDHLVRMVVYGNGFSFITDTLYFNARLPGIGIDDIRVISPDSVVVSIQLNSQGIDTYARLAYGPVGEGYPDTTAAVARANDTNIQYFDMVLTGLTSVTQYQVKLLVQDQADLNKIVVSNTSTFTTNGVPNVDFDAIAGTALVFDASATYLTFANTASLNALTNHTIQMWFKTDDATRAVQFLTSKGSEFMEIHLSGANRSLRFIPRNGAFYDTPSNTVTTGEWTHISATYDAVNASVKVYLNGVDIPLTASGFNSANPFAGTYTTSEALVIGRRSDFSYTFGGVIDEVRIWNGARTQLQVWDDMHGTVPSVFQPDLVLYAQLNEGAGSLVSDAAQGHTGYRISFFDDSSWIPSTIPINENAEYSTELTGQAGWRLLTSPVQTTIGDLLANIWTQGFTGASSTTGSPNVFTWNASATDNSASNWIPASSASQELAAGEGVFVYVYATDPDGQGSFPKTISVTGNGTWGASALTSRLNPNPDGWALVGNPYSTDIVWGDFSRSGMYNVPYIWDANGDEWATWNGSTGSLADGRIGAFNAFFVATMSESPTLSVPFTARRAGPNQFVGKAMENQSVATFSLKVESPDGRSNRAWFSFDAKGKLGLDEFDAFKLAPYSQEYVQLSSVIQDSIRLDINHLPMLTDELSIPLRITSTANGIYRLTLNGNALPSGWDYAIIDTETGMMSRLDDVLEFTWTGAGAELDRFMLKISPTTITHVEPIAEMPLVFGLDQNVPNPFNPSTVIGFTLGTQNLASVQTSLKVYDILGRQVAVLVDGVMPAGRHSVTFDGKELASGMYIYRLQSGDKVLSRKFTLIK